MLSARAAPNRWCGTWRICASSSSSCRRWTRHRCTRRSGASQTVSSPALCYHGFCHVSSHFYVHMSWNPHKSIVDRPFCEGFFQTCCIASLVFFPQTSAHKWLNGRLFFQTWFITILRLFFIFFVFYSKMGSNLQCWPFIPNGLKFQLWLSQVHAPPTLEHKIIFLSIFSAKLHHTYSSNLSNFS